MDLQPFLFRDELSRLPSSSLTFKISLISSLPCQSNHTLFVSSAYHLGRMLLPSSIDYLYPSVFDAPTDDIDEDNHGFIFFPRTVMVQNLDSLLHTMPHQFDTAVMSLLSLSRSTCIYPIHRYNDNMATHNDSKEDLYSPATPINNLNSDEFPGNSPISMTHYEPNIQLSCYDDAHIILDSSSQSTSLLRYLTTIHGETNHKPCLLSIYNGNGDRKHQYNHDHQCNYQVHSSFPQHYHYDQPCNIQTSKGLPQSPSSPPCLAHHTMATGGGFPIYHHYLNSFPEDIDYASITDINYDAFDLPLVHPNIIRMDRDHSNDLISNQNDTGDHDDMTWCMPILSQLDYFCQGQEDPVHDGFRPLLPLSPSQSLPSPPSSSPPMTTFTSLHHSIASPCRKNHVHPMVEPSPATPEAAKGPEPRPVSTLSHQAIDVPTPTQQLPCETTQQCSNAISRPRKRGGIDELLWESQVMMRFASSTTPSIPPTPLTPQILPTSSYHSLIPSPKGSLSHDNQEKHTDQYPHSRYRQKKRELTRHRQDVSIKPLQDSLSQSPLPNISLPHKKQRARRWSVMSLDEKDQYSLEYAIQQSLKEL